MQRKQKKFLRLNNVRQIAADVKISVSVYGKSFSLNCVRLPDGKFIVKRGHDVSEKMPEATLSQIFSMARKFAVKNISP